MSYKDFFKYHLFPLSYAFGITKVIMVVTNFLFKHQVLI